MMDRYDLAPEPKPSRSSLIWNILTVLTLIGVVCLIGYFIAVFQNPARLPAFLQPPPLPTVYKTATPTVTPTQPTPTSTLTPTIEPSPTRTKAPTWTPLPELTTPTMTLTPTETVSPTITTTPMPVSAKIEYKASTTVHPDSACKWFGVGGIVLTAEGKPLQFQVVQLGGKLDDLVINQMRTSGLDALYGASGFEFILPLDHPVSSTQALWIQLFDATGLIPLSDKIYFDTYEDCNKNLILVTFTKNQ